MEKQIKVSIIVPAYNVEDYIEACLNSLVNQTLEEIEIIIVNDGATDSTPQIIEKYAQKDSRIKIINQKNQGQASARNRGIEASVGEFIGFIDSDDYVDLEYFEKLYATAKKNNADMTIASILKHKKDYLRYNAKYTKFEIAEKVKDKIKLCADKKKRFFYVWNKLCKTNVIKNNSIFFPEGQVFEDVIFSAKVVYYSNKIVSVPDINYHYIERIGSTVKSNLSEKKINDRKTAYCELQDFAKEKGFKLPERLNYYESYWKNPLIKIYNGKYQEKFMLFGVIPIFKRFKND